MEAAPRHICPGTSGDLSGPLNVAPDGVTSPIVQVNKCVPAGERRNKTPVCISGMKDEHRFLDWIRSKSASKLLAQMKGEILMLLQVGRHLCRPRAGWCLHEQPWWTDMQQASRGCPSKTTKLEERVANWLPWFRVSVFSSVLREMPGHNLKAARPDFLNHGGLQPNRSQHFWFQLPEIYRTKILSIKDKLPGGIVSQQSQ
jgi:hypothetical protein